MTAFVFENAVLPSLAVCLLGVVLGAPWWLSVKFAGMSREARQHERDVWRASARAFFGRGGR